MAAFEHFQDMNDCALKPHMLRTLIREYIPDEKQPLLRSFQLPKLISLIQTHNLLAECFTEAMSQKLIRSWKSAVDDWVNGILLLVSSNSPDKCWLGICLLGLTCQECSPDRFLSSYSNWFQKLLSHIQPPADSQFVKVASCSSLSDLLSRLGRFPNEKKEGNSHAGKLIQPVLKLLNEDAAESVWDGAVSLLYITINLFPACIRHSYDQAEAAIASKILLGKCSSKMLKKLGHCLAVLPKAKGDEDSWGMLMQKILFLINDHLNDAFHGVEEETKCSEAKRLMLPPGKDPPPPLGGITSLSAAWDKVSKSSEQLLTSSVCTLMICCSKMLTNSYPVQVNVPICSLLALIERVLMVDGSLPRTMVPFMTTKQQELTCLELPVLHAHSLQLLIAIIKGVRSQLLPHAAYIARLVMKYFKRSPHPEIRIKLYLIARMLLLSMGVGMAIYLAHDVIDNAFADLKLNIDENVGTSSANLKASTEALLHPSSRKRKHSARTGSFEKQQGRTGEEIEEPKKHQTTPVSVKIAALQAVEALLTSGGTARSENWRSRIDDLLISIAIDSSKRGWANEDTNDFLPHESSSISVDFQLASLSALLVSLLAPTRVRPPHLAEGLELFRRGKLAAGTMVAGFCANALLMLEVLIHPRVLPLEDYGSEYQKNPSEGFPQSLPENTFLGVQKHHYTKGTEYGPSELDDDDLCNKWLENGEEIDVPGNNFEMPNIKPSETTAHELFEKPSLADSFDGTKVPEVREQEAAVAATDSRTRSNEDEVMVESGQVPQESITVCHVTDSSKHDALPRADKYTEGTSIQVCSVASDTDAARFTNHGMRSGEDALADGVGKSNTIHQNVHLGKRKSIISKPDSESSTDSFPDIVDAEPDTDDESESSESHG